MVIPWNFYVVYLVKHMGFDHPSVNLLAQDACLLICTDVHATIYVHTSQLD